jgi:putative transposase
MEIFCWCLMPSHVHLIFRDRSNEPDPLLGRFKSYTSKALQKEIGLKKGESRKEWLQWMFERAGLKASNVKHGVFWQHHNKPIALWSVDVIEQKANYIHNNPIAAGFVTQPEHWKYSSAIDYAGVKGLVGIKMLW